MRYCVSKLPHSPCNRNQFITITSNKKYKIIFTEYFQLLLMEREDTTAFSYVEQLSLWVNEEDKPIHERSIMPTSYCLLSTLQRSIRDIELCNQMRSSQRVASNSNKKLLVALHLAYLLTKRLKDPNHTKEMVDVVYRAVSNLVKLKTKSRLGGTALHMACCRDAVLVRMYPTCQFPLQRLAETLLAFGADPNAKDEEGNTPLHLVAMAAPCPGAAALIGMLLDHGAHIDLTNNKGDTFASLLRGPMHEFVNTAKYVTLSCIAAKTIKQFKIPYKDLVPYQLHTFIANH